MDTIDLCRHCGGNAYLFAAALTAVAFVLWKAGVLVVRPSPAGNHALRWALGIVIWMLAAAVVRAAWIALG
jgi:hypothetical protein